MSARVVAFVPDLLFGSNVQGMLAAGGHEVTLVGSDAAAAEALGRGADVLLVDLTSDAPQRIAEVAQLDLAGARTLAFFSHVEPDVRSAALAAGFDLVVPRSRMNREGAELVAALFAG